MSDIDGIITASPISDVWTALGGERPRRGRARAFYRDGVNRESVSLDDDKGLWYDHAANEGGGVLDLIERICGCTRQAALRWLAEFNGIALEKRTLSPEEKRAHAEAKGRELLAARDARWWALALIALCDQTLDEIGDCDYDRLNMIRLRALYLDSPPASQVLPNPATKQESRYFDPPTAALMAEFNAWHERNPELTAAMVHAGRNSDRRIREILDRFVFANRGAQ
jgi:hypothetical protein